MALADLKRNSPRANMLLCVAAALNLVSPACASVPLKPLYKDQLNHYDLMQKDRSISGAEHDLVSMAGTAAHSATNNEIGQGSVAKLLAFGNRLRVAAITSSVYTRLINFVIWFVCMLLFGMYYKGSKADVMSWIVSDETFTPDKILVEEASKKEEFVFGLLGCCEEPKLFCFGCCCPAIRWADTIGMAGHNGWTFWGALELFVWIVLFMTISGGLLGYALVIGVLTYFRQRLREKFKLPFGDFRTIVEDCCCYACCTPCAIAQEARQVEFAAQV